MTMLDSTAMPGRAVSLRKAQPPHLPTFVKPTRKPGFFGRRFELSLYAGRTGQYAFAP